MLLRAGRGTPPTGGGPAVGPAGHGTYLRYQAGGVGNPGFAGSAAWNVALGRNWSHEFAERIVPETPGDPGTVWLLTRWGTFRKFSGLSNGVYATRVPSDEYRRLEWIGNEWKLHELDGTIHTFDSAGLWRSTLPRNGQGPGWVATYDSGRLVRVDFPDGRHETFEYHASGKLWRITQVGRESTDSRPWELTWNGDDLERIDRPGGSAWSFLYGSTAHPGYMTRMILIGAGGGPSRVEAAWEYDASGNVDKTWKGADSFTDSEAVEKWDLSYDDPADPSQTTAIPRPADRSTSSTTATRRAASRGSARSTATARSADRAPGRSTRTTSRHPTRCGPRRWSRRGSWAGSGSPRSTTTPRTAGRPGRPRWPTTPWPIRICRA
ncbi:MAG: hypothetical protein M5U13_13510 [Thermoanaerobaculia bacterium]|nr:hypothetical protein [Thermoanaerobaculia bacterium]